MSVCNAGLLRLAISPGAVTDCLCDLQVIWPYSAGEVIVQNYNAVLSLAHLYQSADIVFAVENDAIHNICTRLLAVPKVSFYDINRVIAQQLALSLVPACAGNNRSLIRSHIGEVSLIVFIVIFARNRIGLKSRFPCTN